VRLDTGHGLEVTGALKRMAQVKISMFESGTTFSMQDSENVARDDNISFRGFEPEDQVGS
jgi:hypothetical protein